MDDFETRLSGLLHDRAAAARPFEQLDSVVDPFDEPVRAVAGGRSASLAGRVWRPLVGVAAATLLIVGLVAINGRDTPRNAGGPGVGSGPRFSFVTPQVSLTADDFWIEVGGTRYTSLGAQVEVHSDPGDAAHETLELVWHEQGREMRLFIYFQSDGAHWSSDELRTYNAQLPEPEWVTFTGDHFRSELGSPWTGTFDQTATEGGVTSHLHMDGVRLQAFLAFGPGGVAVPTTQTIVPPTGGTLVVPPLAAGLPDTGIAWVPESALALAMANEVLLHECLVAKGWDYPLRSPDAWVAESGAWQPDDFFGIVGSVGALAYGYHDANAKASSPLETYAASLSESERTRFYNDLMPGEPVVDITGPDGSVLAQRSDGGCFGVAAAALNPLSDSQEGLRMSLQLPALESAPALAAADRAVATALEVWSACVEGAVGETAATPNELARRYAFEGATATAHEIDVAVADVDCQQQADLWHMYHAALARAERSLIGDRVTDYDELTRQRVELVALARQLLADRGIAVPSLD